MVKIFALGCNKTATATLHHIFLSNGLTSQHGGSTWEIDKYQCFSDNGDLQDLEHIYKKYPTATYILNTRSLRGWFLSRLNHCIKRKTSWGWPATIDTLILWNRQREAHHKKVLQFFKDKPGKLIQVNIDIPGWDKELCSKLGLKYVPVRDNMTNEHYPEAIALVDAYYSATA